MRRLLVVFALLLAARSSARQGPDAIDTAFEAYWRADEARAASKAGERLARSGIDFETAWRRLKAGRQYGGERTGELTWRVAAAPDAAFENRIRIPEEYDPARSWPMRVQLHGGVNRPPPNPDTGRPGGRGRGANRIASANEIEVFPTAWNDAAWWHTIQVDNIRRVIDRVKRRYNVDESRVYLTGISDGGTGAYYVAMRDPTPWSAFLPLNGSIKVLGNPAVRADGNLHVANLVNKPFFIVNGGRDPLYPISDVQTHIAVFERLGVPLVFRPQPEAGHDVSWWPLEQDAFEAFVRTHPRDPHPERLSWETERTDYYSRVHWLVIDALGATSSDASFEDWNFLPHPRRSGRVDVVRRGNRVEARTRGVTAFTLLLSPDVFDFDSPLAVIVNGREAFTGRVSKEVSVLLKWAALDNDRTMLYGAELKVRVP